jgi:hypothetical protein
MTAAVQAAFRMTPCISLPRARIYQRGSVRAVRHGAALTAKLNDVDPQARGSQDRETRTAR